MSGYYFLVCCVLLGLLLHPVQGSDGPLDYADQAKWGGDCNAEGKAQSPVNVVITSTLKDQGTLIQLKGNTDNQTATNGNADSSIKFSFEGDITYTIPGLTDMTGKVLQLHLHWGATANNGSEHTFDGKRYSAEAHLVTTYNDAQGDSKLAVIGRFFDVGAENAQLAKMIASQKAEGDNRKISGFNLGALYPSSIEAVVTYSGSLTTPDCTEIVHWIVVPAPLTVSTEQLEALRTLPLGGGDGDALKWNWRQLQETNDRVFTCLEMNAAPTLILSPLLLLLTALLLH